MLRPGLEYFLLHMDSILATMNHKIGMCFLVEVPDTSCKTARQWTALSRTYLRESVVGRS